MLATSWPGAYIPKTPHSSCGLSSCAGEETRNFFQCTRAPSIFNGSVTCLRPPPASDLPEGGFPETAGDVQWLLDPAAADADPVTADHPEDGDLHVLFAADLLEPFQRARGAGDDEPGLALAEQDRDRLKVLALEAITAGARAAKQAALGHGHRQATVGDVVGRLQNPLPDHRQHRQPGAALQRQVQLRRPAGDLAQAGSGVFGASELTKGLADQYHQVIRGPEPRTANLGHVIDDPDHAYDGGGPERDAAGVVVEADIAGNNRDLQPAARLGHALHRLLQLPEDLPLLRVAEVETVGDGERPSTGRNHVAPSLGDGDGSTQPGVQVAVAAVAVGAQRDCPARALDAHHGGIPARHHDGVVV